MTESKSTRDYIKNWGRTAARSHKPKSFETYAGGLHIGTVSVVWSESASDFVWQSLPTFTGGWSSVHTSETQATDALHTDYYKRMSQMSVGMWLQIMCKRHQMTQAGLAERLKLSRVTVNHWCTGKRLPDVNHWHMLSVLFANAEQCEQRQMLGHMSLLQKKV